MAKIFCDQPDKRFPERMCNRLLPCPVHQPETHRAAKMTVMVSRPEYPWDPRILGVTIGPRWQAIEEKFLRQ